MSSAGAAVLEPSPSLERAATAARPAWREAAWRLLAALAVSLVALAIRLPELDRYATIDESRWVGRSADFAMYLAGRDWDKTFIVGHPGVTTMWLGALGLGPERARAFSYLAGQTDVTRRDGYLEALVAARRAVVLATALALGGAAWLAWGLLGRGPALLGSLLLLADPFLGAHSRLIHLDALLTSFMLLAALASLAFWSGRGWSYAVVAGLFSGLAFLTKAPSVFLVAFVPALALVETARTGGWRRPAGRVRLVGGLAVWLAAALGVGLALWPYFRLKGLGAIRQVLEFAARNAGSERDNFFLGRPVEDPGPVFYPLALLLRATPLLLLGLALLVWLLVARRRQLAARWPILLLGGFAVGFVLMMSLGQKKFDRYALPALPALDLLAGAALWLGWQALPRPRIPVPALAAAVGLAAWPLASVYPYDLAYYNPLLGGGPAAQRLLFVGWGEGLDQVAAYLNARPIVLEAPTVATAYPRALQAHLRENGAMPLERAELADYIVPYVNSIQRDQNADDLAPFLAGRAPEQVIQINGIEYARIYPGPHLPAELTVGATFGDRARLQSAVVGPGSGQARAGDEVALRLRWEPSGDPGGLISSARVARSDGGTLVEDRRSLAGALREGATLLAESRLRLPPSLPAGQYRLEVALLDPAGAPLAMPDGTNWRPLLTLTILAGAR